MSNTSYAVKKMLQFDEVRLDSQFARTLRSGMAYILSVGKTSKSEKFREYGAGCLGETRQHSSVVTEM